MDNPQVTEIELSWLAGIWDGEGTISVRLNRKIMQISPRLNVVNTNPHIMSRVDDILTRIGVVHYIREKGEGGFGGSNKQCWIICIDTLRGSFIWLQYVKPYLVGKVKQAEFLEKFVNSRIFRRIKATRNSDAPYSKEELLAVADLYDQNGNQRGTSETIREAASNAVC